MKFHQILIPCLTLGAAMLAAAPTIKDPTPGMMPPHPPRMPETIPAFPGAWGGGMFITGGRGGRVIEVTNLNDRGPGSLRAAMEALGPRIVVFRVAGIIHLETNINIDHPDITVAGQTAPGDGICIASNSININTENVILRHLRVRRGNPQGGQGSDNIGGNPVGNIIIDHCSTSWGMDENLSLYRYMYAREDGVDVKMSTKNITIQWSISSEALNGKNHAFGGTWGGQDSTFHHNLFANNTGRNPSIGMSGEFDFRNNVVYNWSHRLLDGGDETSLINIINNYFKPGPATNDNMREVIARVESRNGYSPGSAWKAGDWYPKTEKRPGKWYVAGNIHEGSAEVTANNWKGMVDADREGGDVEYLARVNTPFEGWPMIQQSAREAYKSVLAKAGATLPRRDAVDARVTAAVESGKLLTPDGTIVDPAQVGGYPNYSFDPASVPVDTDKDGMPDAWEIKYGLDPQNPADGKADADGDGYTNVEEYLNGTNPREFIDYRNLGNNIDTIS